MNFLHFPTKLSFFISLLVIFMFCLLTLDLKNYIHAVKQTREQSIWAIVPHESFEMRKSAQVQKFSAVSVWAAR